MSLTEAEIHRYSRHIILSEVGGRGQKKLKAASLLLLGLGGCGSSAAMYLAAAGCGRLGLADPQPVGDPLLAGAILYGAAAGEAVRSTAAVGPLLAINPALHAVPIPGWSDPSVAAEWDVVVAAAGDWASWADACAAAGRPLVLVGAAGSTGAVAALQPELGGAPTLQRLQARVPALAPERPPVLAPVAGAVGVAAATEALKLVLGIGRSLAGQALVYDGAAASFSRIGLE